MNLSSDWFNYQFWQFTHIISCKYGIWVKDKDNGYGFTSKLQDVPHEDLVILELINSIDNVILLEDKTFMELFKIRFNLYYDTNNKQIQKLAV